MKKEVKNAITTCLMIILTSSVFSKPKQQPTTPVKEPKIIEVAYTTTNEPYTFINEKGTPDGFELAVLKAVDELIPEYKFKFRGTNDEEVLIGTEKGKYQIAINGLCLTDELKTNFLIPQSPISSNIIGIVIRKENSNEIHDFKSFARYSGNLAPISSQSVLYSVIQNYNEKQHDNQIKLISSDIFKISDSYLQIIEGHYDALLTQKYSFKKCVLDENGMYHQFMDKLSYITYKGIPTYPVFNKNEIELANAYDKAIKQLKENGTISELAQKYFGEDITKYLTE